MSRVSRVNHYVSCNRSKNMSRDIDDIVTINVYNWMNKRDYTRNETVPHHKSRWTYNWSRTKHGKSPPINIYKH